MTSIALTVQSPAKINWNLRVLARRDDGFHEIESLVSAVTLYDELVFTELSDSRVEVSCDCPGVPTDEGNLIVRAAMLVSNRLWI